MINYFWFRRDLRLEDNCGLNAALEQGLNVRPIFIFDTNILKKLKSKKDPRVSFIHQKIKELDQNIKAKGGAGIWVYYGEVKEIWKEILQSQAGDVYCNRDYEPAAIDRDHEVEQILRSHGQNLHSFKDQVIFEEDNVLKKDGTPYSLYPLPQSVGA